MRRGRDAACPSAGCCTGVAGRGPTGGGTQGRGRVTWSGAARRIAPVDDRERNCRAAAGRLDEYDWLVFTSRTPCESSPAGAACAGESTGGRHRGWRLWGRRPLRPWPNWGWQAHACPRATPVQLAAAMAPVAPLRGARVLWPRAAGGAEALPADLAAAGAIASTRQCLPHPALPDAAHGGCPPDGRGQVDVVTLTSPSRLASCLASGAAATDGVVIAAIGHRRRRLPEAGLPVHVVRAPHDPRAG
jgi:uroporphyrinogen-III synthase